MEIITAAHEPAVVVRTTTMAASSLISSSLFSTNQNSKLLFLNNRNRFSNRPVKFFRVRAAKLPAGVEMPKVEPKFQAPFLGFTKTAETWNSRACMIGLIGVFIIELIINRGILQVIGVDVGKGLDLPL
ncbi:light-harvesting complex-like protein OHP1, chloroplastic [Carica papaya]|uniref:Light-harvesting chlorophyll a/b-binding protein n=1 Tax=Carica papaya TaxID=3649 RepID=A0A6M3WHX7_CARPA|nr:light-harvesting complex-like protein OHP1, chloroplastic [Carica papaya]QJF74558.1 light-harvesting chlorophyll a/b-binding protein [Carica papaya]